MLRRLWKPWFVFCPGQLVRRGLAALAGPGPGYHAIPTRWGPAVLADPSRTIGRSILTAGVYDLAVSELLARLIEPGDTVIDAGANVGYMTVLAALAAGPGGRVLAFEPHPELHGLLRRNVAHARRRYPLARTDLHEQALGEREGSAALVVPPRFAANDGLARVVTHAPTEEPSVPVRITTLDSALGAGSARLLKLDVEGHELPVLLGAEQALRSGRVRHIVFEDHQIEDSPVVRLLQDWGFAVSALGWALRGLVLGPVASGGLAKSYEAPSYVATLAPDELAARCRPRGWLVLGGALARRAGRKE